MDDEDKNEKLWSRTQFEELKGDLWKRFRKGWKWVNRDQRVCRCGLKGCIHEGRGDGGVKGVWGASYGWLGALQANRAVTGSHSLSPPWGHTPLVYMGLTLYVPTVYLEYCGCLTPLPQCLPKPSLVHGRCLLASTRLNTGKASANLFEGSICFTTKWPTRLLLLLARKSSQALDSRSSGTFWRNSSQT